MRKSQVNKVDAVFEGGGVKGSALIGAIAVTEDKGYVFENLAGTSGGALVAALLAAGYHSAEIKRLMDEMDYNRFKDETLVDKIPVVGKGLNLLLREGIYKGDFVENWIREILARKGIKTFADLIIEEYADDPRFRYKLQVVASDISNGKLLVLPGDAKNYGIKPDDLEVARALRMSISIPFFFEPVIWQSRGAKNFIVDGGILSNFPVWLLDDGARNPAWPTLGYKLVDPEEGQPEKINGPIEFLKAMFDTMMEAHDARYIADHDFARTIPIPTLGVHTTDFDITRRQKNALYESGKNAALKFFETWDFEVYKKKYYGKVLAHRTERIWKK